MRIAPLVGSQQRREHLDRRGLAGAVRAEKREDLALGDVERDVIDRFDLAECFDQILYVNHACAPVGKAQH